MDSPASTVAPLPSTATATAVTHTVQTVFSIETCNSKTTKFERWVMRLESAFGVFQVPDALRRAYLLHYMGPEAYDILCDKIAPEHPESKSYEELVATMKQQFHPEPVEMAEIYRFLQRKQQADETVQDFLTALRKAAINCKYGSYLEKALRNQFVFGLRDNKIQGRLLQIRDLSLDTAVSTAISMEMSKREAAHLHSQSPCNELNESRAKSNTRNGNRVSNSNVRNYNYSNKSFTCYRCGGDHLATTYPTSNLISITNIYVNTNLRN